MTVGYLASHESGVQACPPGDKGIGYPIPARVYCLAKADS